MNSSRDDSPDFDDSVQVDESTNRTVRRLARLRDALDRRQAGLHVILENVHDPHNASAVLRSCDAVGVDTLHLLYYREEFPKLGHQSSSGSRKWVNVERYDSIEACIERFRHAGIPVLASTAGSDRNLYDLDLTRPVALLFGNEHRGVSDNALDAADGTFGVPMMGLVESLNISVACAVTLYEALRQRQAAGLYESPSLPNEERQRRLDEWIKR